MRTLTDQQFTLFYERHVAMVYRVCFAYLKASAPTEDAVQETFIKAWRQAPQFESEAHETGWLVKTASNLCKDILKSWWRRKVGLDPDPDSCENLGIDNTLLAILALPDKYKAAVYLYYYEGYRSAEIAQILGRTNSTVRSYLSEARTLLRLELEEK
jgi:RNA polymerase sigma-70 factor (ECF subfamily)